jgi:hypothetical protein
LKRKPRGSHQSQLSKLSKKSRSSTSMHWAWGLFTVTSRMAALANLRGKHKIEDIDHY